MADPGSKRQSPLAELEAKAEQAVELLSERANHIEWRLRAVESRVGILWSVLTVVGLSVVSAAMLFGTLWLMEALNWKPLE